LNRITSPGSSDDQHRQRDETCHEAEAVRDGVRDRFRNVRIDCRPILIHIEVSLEWVQRQDALAPENEVHDDSYDYDYDNDDRRSLRAGGRFSVSARERCTDDRHYDQEQKSNDYRD
jgi:predicted phage gp36 major capsid-like protein